MSDVPAPVQSKAAGQQKQLIMLAVLGLVFLLVLVFVVIKPFGGDDSATTPAPTVTTPTTPTSAPATGTGSESGGSEGSDSESESSEEPVAVERPARNPFVGP